ncbi:MAG: methyltransferase [Gemmatimonadales bacterium]|nr:methyltransferase [Gemmatimonadales bacterium]NIN12791.1 methyltransferase [Gemmatimonadales bacterium]NIN51016.1 methyltransferase [Gemmatimonadales bacterium]NIP08480.1 methyltransferase [Gemmatimonadales bacterium]NIR00916.1 methyltransferase [Gemmatimonadales bacterium]
MPDESVSIEQTGGLGPITVLLPPDKLSLTPASYMAVRAIGRNRHLLSGNGIDWGSGSGCLAIAAAKLEAVERIVGLELAQEDVAVARQNAIANGVLGKVAFLHADSFAPFSEEDVGALDVLAGSTDFLIANPPASQGDDGLGWRRRVLEDARRFLVSGAPVLLQISYQYGQPRIRKLAEDVPGYRYEGVLASTDWVPFDQERSDLASQLEEYGAEEERGGLAYTFPDPERPDWGHINARQALAYHRSTGMSPLSKWQMHLFRRI